MSYFDKFPKGNYSTDNVTYKQVTDLFRKIKIKEKLLEEASLYQETWRYINETLWWSSISLDCFND